jgi:hypothetical protein
VRRLALGVSLALGEQLRTLTRSPAPSAGRPGDDQPAARDLGTGAPVEGLDVGHLLIGLAAVADDRVREATEASARVLGATASAVAPMARWISTAPFVAPITRRVERGLDDLVARGRLEDQVSRQQAGELFTVTIDTVSSSPVIDGVIHDVVGRALQPILDQAIPQVMGDLQHRPELIVPLVEAIVGQVLDPILATAIPQVLGELSDEPELILPLVQSIVSRALQPILDQALPQVLDQISAEPELLMPLVEAIVDEALEPILRDALPKVMVVLNEDPDAIRSLVRDQSTGIAGEMTETVRVRAADADERVDRIVRRILRRPAPTGLKLATRHQEFPVLAPVPPAAAADGDAARAPAPPDPPAAPTGEVSS